MRILVFHTKPYTRQFFTRTNEEGNYGHDLVFTESKLNEGTIALLSGTHYDAVCVFVNDVVNRSVILGLKQMGVRAVLLRCAGFNNVDIQAAEECNIDVVRVPAYSPTSVAEHTLALLLCLNRKLHKAYARVREGNFALEGLLGFNLQGKTVGVIGTGRIGASFIELLRGFRVRVLCYDVHPNPHIASGEAPLATYVPLETLYRESDVISLHVPLTPETHHMVHTGTLEQMKRGVMLINTSRGHLVDTKAVLHHLKTGHLGSFACDVYEEEADLFFEDLSNTIIQDDVFARLVTFPNVLVTGHQAFFTGEALHEIAVTCLGTARQLERSEPVGACRVTHQFFEHPHMPNT